MKLTIFVDFILPPDALELLHAGTAGHQLILSQTPASSVLEKAEWDPSLGTFDIVFGQPDPLHIEKASHLKWVHINTSGITRYDNTAFRSLIAERNIVVSNSAEVYKEQCAAHILSFMLAQSRNLFASLLNKTAGGPTGWQTLRSSCISLRGQTVLIAGYGAIGKRLTEMLRPFDMNILAYRRTPQGNEGISVITEDQLDSALSSDVDHIVNILPESAETRGFFSSSRFSIIKPGAVFYNIGRGATVDQDALLDSLRSGRITAAWLDVTTPEPLPENHPLRMQPNCFITPHVAGGASNESILLVRHFLGNLERFVKGEMLVNRIM